MLAVRRGAPADNYTVFNLHENALTDLMRRIGVPDPERAANPEVRARIWSEREGLYDHLGQTAEQFWIAEEEGQPAGFARTTMRDGLRELTELFVSPAAQSTGIGRTLLDHAFPAEGARRRVIVSSPDVRAQALYMKHGLFPRSALYYFWREPTPTAVDSDLTIEEATATPGTLEALGAIDEQVIGHRRDADHRFLLDDRQGFLYRRDGRVVGYGYAGVLSGPFAVLDPVDLPAALAHAENRVAGRQGHFGVEVPTLSSAAMAYLLARGFRLSPFVATLMSDEPFGLFDRYLLTNPPYFL